MSFKNSPTSASRRKVLGRGLDSLFSPVSEQGNQKDQKKPPVLILGIEQIHPNPHQPRRVFDKEFLKDLANSIRKNGLIQPVVVKKSGLKYEIVAGERRWRAAAQAGLHEIPVRVLDQQVVDSDILALVENLQRQDLTSVELAQAYKKLMESKSFTQENLADQLGIPRATLANQLRVLNLSPEVQKLILDGRISFALAKILLQEKEFSSQLKWARYFIKHKTGVRKAQQLLSKEKPPSPPPSPTKTWQHQALDRIRDVHGVKSSLRFKEKGGELCLRFFSDEQLRYLMDILIRQP